MEPDGRAQFEMSLCDRLSSGTSKEKIVEQEENLGDVKHVHN